MSSIQPPITTRLLRTDPEALRQQLTTTTLDARTATDLVKQAGYLGTLTPAQLDVFTAAAASPGASAVARDVVQTFLSGLQQKPASASLFSFLHWKPAPSPSVAVAADRAVTDATRKATGAVRAFLATVDPLLARTSLSQLLGRKDIAAAILHLDNAPAHNVATSELLKSLLKEIKAPPPFADVYAQVGKRSVDTSFATELLRSAALSSSPAAAYEKIADLEHSRVPMSECGRAFCAGINQASADLLGGDRCRAGLGPGLLDARLHGLDCLQGRGGLAGQSHRKGQIGHFSLTGR